MSNNNKYRKKPVVIEAIQYTGDVEAIGKFVPGVIISGRLRINGDRGPAIVIRTLEGDMTADIDDWIIKGVKGEFYPCKPDIFRATYEKVEP